MKLLSKKKLNEKFDRYDLSVKYNSNFIANGVVAHNSNLRMGLVLTDDGFVWMCGSHNVNRKEFTASGHKSVFWKFLHDNVKKMLINCNAKYSAIIYGERFGSGVQDMHYGRGSDDFVAFDICVDGQYLDWDDFKERCQEHDIDTVPIIYEGPFSFSIIDEYTDGPTTLCKEEDAGRFKGREGIVIKSKKERNNSIVGRAIAKSVSVDYLSRKGGTDNA